MWIATVPETVRKACSRTVESTPPLNATHKRPAAHVPSRKASRIRIWLRARSTLSSGTIAQGHGILAESVAQLAEQRVRGVDSPSIS